LGLLARLFRRLTGDRPAHPLLGTAAGLKLILDQAPAVLLLTNEAVENVYRNSAAVDMLNLTIGRDGQDALLKLRAVLKHVCLTSTTFPASHQFHVDVRGQRVYATLIVNKVPGGFVYTWKNVTSEVRFTLLHDELARELATASTGLTSLGERLTEATRAAAEEAGTMSRASRELTVATREISERVHAAGAGTETAVASANSASTSVGRLQDSSDRIGGVTGLIDAIAGKTRMLALNASIEAARAGELGRGFAVVAGEVRDLAAQTADATREITAMIAELQAESARAAGAIAEIVEHIGKVNEEQCMIGNAVEEQTAVTAEMSVSIESAAAAVRAAAETSEQVHAAAAAINGQAARLREVVSSEAQTRDV
jgi:hypothetical protein